MKIESIVQPIGHQLGPNDSLSTVARLLEDEGITALPVTNDDGILLGLITAQDMIAASAEASDRTEARTVAELVRPAGVTCTLAAEVMLLAHQASSHSHSHVVVLDELGNLVGIADLSPYQASFEETQHREDALDEALEETFPASDPIAPP